MAKREKTVFPITQIAQKFVDGESCKSGKRFKGDYYPQHEVICTEKSKTLISNNSEALKIEDGMLTIEYSSSIDEPGVRDIRRDIVFLLREKGYLYNLLNMEDGHTGIYKDGYGPAFLHYPLKVHLDSGTFLTENERLEFVTDTDNILMGKAKRARELYSTIYHMRCMLTLNSLTKDFMYHTVNKFCRKILNFPKGDMNVHFQEMEALLCDTLSDENKEKIDRTKLSLRLLGV